MRPSSPPTTAAVGPLGGTANGEPWDYYERLRQIGDVVWDADANAWLVTSYELVRQVAQAEDTVWQSVNLPDASRSPLGMDAEAWADFMCVDGKNVILRVDGEAHRRAHRWWMKALAPDVLDRWRTTVMQPALHGRVDDFIGRGRAELASELADKASTRIIARVLGIAADDEWMEGIQRVSADRSAIRQHLTDQADDPQLAARARIATDEIAELLRPFVEERRAGDGDDFISMIWRDAEQLFGAEYDVADVIGTAAAAWEAGAGTSSFSATNAIYALMRDAELGDRLRRDGTAAIRRFSEETLRLSGPLMFRPKFAIVDTELGGVPIEKGAMVIAVTAAANRDPARFRCPAAVELDRPAPRDHFSFWLGRRICAGQALGRALIEETVAVVVDRLDGLRFDPNAEPPRFDGLIARRWCPLHALFAAAPARGEAAP